MNVQLQHTGKAGLAIVDAILAGQRDAKELARLRDARNGWPVFRWPSVPREPGSMKEFGSLMIDRSIWGWLGEHRLNRGRS